MCLFVVCGACGWLGGVEQYGPRGIPILFYRAGRWSERGVDDPESVRCLPMYDQLPGVPRRRALLEALQRARRLRVLLLGNQ